MAKSIFKKWAEWLKRIEDDQLRDLLVSNHIFGQFQKCTAPYDGTNRAAQLHEWLTINYVAFATTTIRRIVEPPNKRWKSVSLRILLEDIATNSQQLTRKRYKSFYNGSRAARWADHHFNELVGNKRALFISENAVRRDIKRLERACSAVHRMVNKVVAHTELDRRKLVRVKQRDLEAASKVIVGLFEKYSRLINGNVCSPIVPLQDISVMSDLKKIWP